MNIGDALAKMEAAANTPAQDAAASGEADRWIIALAVAVALTLLAGFILHRMRAR